MATTEPTIEKKAGSPEIMHSFTEKKTTKSTSSNYMVWLILIALVGVGSGYLLTMLKSSSGGSLVPASLNSTVSKGKTFGSNDTKTFKDTAEGTLQDGGIDGEGQYHLVRSGGDSQNVYLTSSSVDMSVFVGKKIKVWGQTQTAQKAGWLMDVGRVEVE